MSVHNDDVSSPTQTDIARQHDFNGQKSQSIDLIPNTDDQDPQYYEASSMTSLSAASLAALARLRSYKPPPFALWDKLPLSRRAAVLLLLYPDKRGDIRVVITMRSASLRSFAGHAALPGGRADTLVESPWEVARREAWEEIGLPAMNDQLPDGFTLEALCMLPCSLARTGVVVRPCIAFLQDAGASAGHGTEDQLVPKLDAREVAAVFSAPFHGFLSRKCARTISPMVQEQWYNGNWTEWHGRRWRNHSFQVPLDSQKVTKPRDSISRSQEHDLEKTEKAETENLVYRVWGMTARILIDAARIAYGEEPDFDHNEHVGDEETIVVLHSLERMGERGIGMGAEELTMEDWKRVGAMLGGAKI